MSRQPIAFALVPVPTNVTVPKKPLPSPKERKELQGGDENASGGFYNSIKSSSRKKGAVKRAPLAAKMTVPETSPLASSKRSRRPEPKQRPAVSPLTLSARKPTVAKKSQPEDVAQEDAQKVFFCFFLAGIRLTWTSSIVHGEIRCRPFEYCHGGPYLHQKTRE